MIEADHIAARAARAELEDSGPAELGLLAAGRPDRPPPWVRRLEAVGRRVGRDQVSFFEGTVIAHNVRQMPSVRSEARSLPSASP